MNLSSVLESPRARPILRELLIFSAFAALTALNTWPWVLHIRDSCSDVGDPYLVSWIFWWDFHQTFHDPLNLFHGNIFFPLKYSLAFSEHNYGIALLFFPAFALGLRPLTVHSLAVMLGFILSGYGAFRLARTATGSTGAAWVAGIAFAFTPFRFHHLPHVTYLFAGWMPLTLEALILFVRERSRKRAAWLGVAFLMNGLSVIHWFILSAIPLAATGVFLAFRRQAERDPRLWKRGGMALGAASLALLPFFLPYQKASQLYGFVRSPENLRAYSAFPKHWLTADPRNHLWAFLGSPAEGELALFPGLLPLLLPLAAFFLVGKDERVESAPALPPEGGPDRRILAVLDAFSLAAGAVAVYTSVWPLRIKVGGHDVFSASEPTRALFVLAVALLLRWATAYPEAFWFIRGRNIPDSLRKPRRHDALGIGLIWALLGFFGSFGLNFPFHRILFETLFVFRSIRAPCRWAMVAHLGLALLSGLGALRLAERLGRGRLGPRAPAAVYSVLAIALLFELRAAPLGDAVIRGEADPDEATLFLKRAPMRGGIVELPTSTLEHGNYRYVLRAADHGKPLVNAVSGFAVPHVEKLEELTQPKKPVPLALLDLLESFPTSYLVVHGSWYDREDLLSLREVLNEGLRTGRLRFIRRFDGRSRNDVFAITKTEPDAQQQQRELPWKLDDAHLLTQERGREDGLPGNVDTPAEGEVVKGELVVKGWARTPQEDLHVTLIIDGETRAPLLFRRFPRPDVASLLPQFGDCSGAGFEARYAFEPGGEGVHEIRAIFHSSGDTVRHYPVRKFEWRP